MLRLPSLKTCLSRNCQIAMLLRMQWVAQRRRCIFIVRYQAEQVCAAMTIKIELKP